MGGEFVDFDVDFNEENSLKVELGGSFLINAGICGLIKALEINDAEEDIDYKISDTCLYLSKEYLQNTDLAQFYINAFVDTFKENSRYYEFLSTKKSIVENYKNKEELSKEDEKFLNLIFKDFSSMLEKNSFKNGYGVLNERVGVEPISLELISQFKKEKDLPIKFDLYFELCRLLEQPQAEEILLMKEIIYSKTKFFYEGISFFLPANVKKDLASCYIKDFVEPLLKEIEGGKKTQKRCLECSNLVQETRSISFMLDTTNDVNRKKNYYWNQKVDAFVCSLCSFVYTFVPLGFVFNGQEAIFINTNNSINGLVKIMNNYEAKLRDDVEERGKTKLFRIFTDTKLNILKEKINNIQVIVRSTNKNHYSMNILSKDMLNKLIKGQKELNNLERKFLKTDNGFINVYDLVVENILAYRNQYNLIYTLFREDLKENRNVNYLKNILSLQIIFQGGKKMEDLKKKSDIAFLKGRDLRGEITQGISEKDTDNHLRGFVYRLANAVAVNNRDLFLDSVIRIYSGRGLSMPAIFKETFSSDEVFKVISQAFILGLKYQKYEKEENNQEAK